MRIMFKTENLTNDFCQIYNNAISHWIVIERLALKQMFSLLIVRKKRTKLVELEKSA